MFVCVRNQYTHTHTTKTQHCIFLCTHTQTRAALALRKVDYTSTLYHVLLYAGCFLSVFSWLFVFAVHVSRLIGCIFLHDVGGTVLQLNAISDLTAYNVMPVGYVYVYVVL